MLVFGIDVPLIEVVLGLAVVTFILLAEALIVVVLLIKQINKSRKLMSLVEKLSQTILEIKKVEIEELDKLRSRR
jgi:hypothetical protein